MHRPRAWMECVLPPGLAECVSEERHVSDNGHLERLRSQPGTGQSTLAGHIQFVTQASSPWDRRTLPCLCHLTWKCRSHHMYVPSMVQCQPLTGTPVLAGRFSEHAFIVTGAECSGGLRCCGKIQVPSRLSGQILCISSQNIWTHFPSRG